MNPENTCHRGKYHFTAGLRYDWIGFHLRRKYVVICMQYLNLLNPNQLNWRLAVQTYFLLGRVSVFEESIESSAL